MPRQAVWARELAPPPPPADPPHPPGGVGARAGAAGQAAARGRRGAHVSRLPVRRGSLRPDRARAAPHRRVAAPHGAGRELIPPQSVMFFFSGIPKEIKKKLS